MIYIVSMDGELVPFWPPKITGGEIGMFGLKSGRNHFGLMEFLISDVTIAQSRHSSGI